MHELKKYCALIWFRIFAHYIDKWNNGYVSKKSNTVGRYPRNISSLKWYLAKKIQLKSQWK